MLKTLCNQEKPGKDAKHTFLSERFNHNKHPDCDKKRTTPYRSHQKT